MDRVSQAEQTLATIGGGMVAGRALSPMDCQRTVPVPGAVIRACEQAAGTVVGPAATRPAPVPVMDPEMTRAAAGVDRARRTGRRGA